MGLLDDLGKQVLGNVLGGGGGEGAAGKLDLVQMGIALLNKFGGIEGLMKQFSENGFGNLIASWVGSGKNLPISGDQILSALGPQHVAEVAQEAGVETRAAANGLADILPGLVDKLTPDGQSVSGDVLKQGISSLLGGKFGDLSKLFG
jgi:uncharacterized protein YidB (DUF937 family)